MPKPSKPSKTTVNKPLRKVTTAKPRKPPRARVAAPASRARAAGVSSQKSAEDQLAAFAARYTPEIERLGLAAVERMRGLLPGAVEIVYDNYNALVIGFGPSERASEAICSIVFYPRWVSLFLFQSTDLPDPENLLRGSGARSRHLVLENAATLDRPAVRALVAHAHARAMRQVDAKAPRRMVIRSVSAKQRPRRPA